MTAWLNRPHMPSIQPDNDETSPCVRSNDPGNIYHSFIQQTKLYNTWPGMSRHTDQPILVSGLDKPITTAKRRVGAKGKSTRQQHMIFLFHSLLVTCHASRCGPWRLRSCLDTQHRHGPSATTDRRLQDRRNLPRGTLYLTGGPW